MATYTGSFENYGMKGTISFDYSARAATIKFEDFDKNADVFRSYFTPGQENQLCYFDGNLSELANDLHGIYLADSTQNSIFNSYADGDADDYVSVTREFLIIIQSAGEFWHLRMWIGKYGNSTEVLRSVSEQSYTFQLDQWVYNPIALATFPPSNFTYGNDAWYDSTATIPGSDYTYGSSSSDIKIEGKELGEIPTIGGYTWPYTSEPIGRCGQKLLPILEALGATVTDGKVIDHWSYGLTDAVVAADTELAIDCSYFAACWTESVAKTQNLYFNGSVPTVINYNGSAVSEVYYNGTLVWES